MQDLNNLDKELLKEVKSLVDDFDKKRVVRNSRFNKVWRPLFNESFKDTGCPSCIRKAVNRLKNVIRQNEKDNPKKSGKEGADSDKKVESKSKSGSSTPEKRKKPGPKPKVYKDTNKGTNSTKKDK